MGGRYIVMGLLGTGESEDRGGKIKGEDRAERVALACVCVCVYLCQNVIPVYLPGPRRGCR